MVFVGSGLTLIWLGGRLARPRVPFLVQKLVKLAAAFLLFFGYARLLVWNPLWAWLTVLGISRQQTLPAFLGIGILFWLAISAWIVLSRNKIGGAATTMLTHPKRQITGTPGVVPQESIPRLSFVSVGGMEKAKQQIRELVETRLNPQKYHGYGITKNGILLHGPEGTGKTLLARASAGEFGLALHRVASAALFRMAIGATSENIREEFKRAVANAPSLLFLDEIDAIGARRQGAGTGSDPGGGGRELNSAVTELMQCIDEYRSVPGFVYIATTNRLDVLDPALTRDERWDLKIRVDIPDESAREQILLSLISSKPSQPFDLTEFARQCHGFSAANLRSVVDQAAIIAANENRLIEAKDLRRALEERGGADRPFFSRVDWEDLVLEEQVDQDLRTLIRLLEDRELAREIRVAVPTGLLLIGPSGTGKSMIGRLIATKTRRSYYAIGPADVLGGNVGDSVKRVQEIMRRAKENSPSVVFFDEMDGLFPDRRRAQSQHDIQVVDQFLIEVSDLDAHQNVFLLGATNHPEKIDPSVLAGHRFQEHWIVKTLEVAGLARLLEKLLRDVTLEPGTSPEGIAREIVGASQSQAQAICLTARRSAFGRMRRMHGFGELPPLNLQDFEDAARRVLGPSAAPRSL
jgi:transitional endoplasmic reticulum ATPase